MSLARFLADTYGESKPKSGELYADKYLRELQEQGFETLEDLLALDSADIDVILGQIGMLPGHKVRFRRTMKEHKPGMIDLESYHFKHVRNPDEKGSKPPFRIVFIGRVGSGKTSLFNALTGKNEAAAAGTESVTRESVGEPDKSGMLYLIDTPGLGAQKEKLEHAKNLREALRLKDGVHAVVFVTELAVRTDTAADDLKSCITLLQPFRHNLFVLFNKVDLRVENMDLCSPKDDNGNCIDSPGLTLKEKYIDMIDQIHGPHGYIFYHKGVGGEWLADALAMCCLQCDPIKYDYSDFEFAWNFDIERTYTREERDKMDALVNDFRQLCNTLWEQLQDIDDDPKVKGKKNIFLSDLAFTLNETAEEKVKEFTEIFKDGDVTPEIYADYMSTKKKLAQPLKVMIEKLQQMKGEEVDLASDHYRQCPYCGAVWYKKPSRLGGMGCDGMTTCGNRGELSTRTMDQHEFAGLTFKFTVNRDTNTVSWEPNQRDGALSPDPETLAERLAADTTAGCGATITWNKLPRVHRDKLKQLNLEVSDLPGEMEVVSMEGGKITLAATSPASASMSSGNPKIDELRQKLKTMLYDLEMKKDAPKTPVDLGKSKG